MSKLGIFRCNEKGMTSKKNESFFEVVVKVVLFAAVLLLTLDTIHVRFILKIMAEEIIVLRTQDETHTRDITDILKLKSSEIMANGIGRRLKQETTDVEYQRRRRRNVGDRDIESLRTFLNYLSMRRSLPKVCITNHTIMCLPGKKGEKGDRGKSGPIGPIGKAGVKGDMGPRGPRGPVGVKGDTGNIGPKGERGQKGDDGKSIYSPIITFAPKSVNVLEGRNATFFCDADGNPFPKIEWQFEDRKVDKNRYKFSGENGLSIYNVRSEDSGQIVCIANNIMGTARKHASLIVLVKPRALVIPEQITAEIGSTVNISCNAEGNPLPSVTWSKAYGTLRAKKMNTHAGKTLIIQNVRKQDAGLYVCRAKNSVGNAMDTSVLAVIDVHRTCNDAFRKGKIKNGIYKMKPDSGLPFEVFCDMTTDGGGWTVLQRRKDGKVSFYRKWAEYKTGFGVLSGNFWLGLENIHRLTNVKQDTVLRVEVRHKTGKNGFAKYNTFRVSNEADKYRLKVAGYSGNAGNSLGVHNGMYFSTYDVDNDKWYKNCANYYRGAWWHASCHTSNLNGDYPPASGSTNPKYMSWHHLVNQFGNIIFSEMKIR